MRKPAARIMRRVGLIVTCVAEDAPRLAAATIANRLEKVHLDIGPGVFTDRDGRYVGGDIRLLLPGDTCIQSLGSPADLGLARYEVAAPPGAS